MKKWRKTHVCRNKGKPPSEKRTFDIFASCISSIIQKWKKIQKNMCTTLIDLKFDEKSKSELRIGLPCKEKLDNAENFRKIIKLLVYKKKTMWKNTQCTNNNLKEHQKRQLLAPGRCPQTRESFSYNGFSILRFFEFPAFSCTNRGKKTLESCSAWKNTSSMYFWVFFGGHKLQR